MLTIDTQDKASFATLIQFHRQYSEAIDNAKGDDIPQENVDATFQVRPQTVVDALASLKLNDIPNDNPTQLLIHTFQAFITQRPRFDTPFGNIAYSIGNVYMTAAISHDFEENMEAIYTMLHNHGNAVFSNGKLCDDDIAENIIALVFNQGRLLSRFDDIYIITDKTQTTIMYTEEY